MVGDRLRLSGGVDLSSRVDEVVPGEWMTALVHGEVVSETRKFSDDGTVETTWVLKVSNVVRCPERLVGDVSSVLRAAEDARLGRVSLPMEGGT